MVRGAPRVVNSAFRELPQHTLTGTFKIPAEGRKCGEGSS